MSLETAGAAHDPSSRPGVELSWREQTAILWSYARPHWGLISLGGLLGLVATGSELATPMVVKWVLDGLAHDASLRTPITVLALLLVLGSAIGLIQAIMLGTLAERIILGARTGVIAHLLRLRVSDLAQRPAGEMVTRVTSDTLLIREATTSSIVNGLNGVVGGVGSLILMGVLDLTLLGTTLAVVALVSGAALVLMPALSRAQQEAQRELGLLGGRLEGVLRGLRTVKASRAEAREAARIGEYARASAKQGVRAVRLEAWSMTITEAGLNLAIMIVLGVGAWRVSSGELEVSTLVAFLLYAFQLALPVTLVTMSVTSLQSGLAAAARIGEITGLEPETDEPGTDEQAGGDAGVSGGVAVSAGVDTVGPMDGGVGGRRVLELRDVVFRYAPDAAPALDGVSLSVPRRGHTAVVGPSGAGKTTIFSLLLKFVQPQSGVILLDERPLDHWTLEDLRSRLAYVEQDTPLLPGTLRENLLYAAPDAPEDAVWRALATVRMDERVRALPGVLDTDVTASTLSGGERQRIALARALVAEPEVLLLDEVTAQLDGLTEAAVARGIRRQAERGAVVTIAHRLSTVMDADQIVVLDGGRVRAVGTHDALVASDDLYRELVAALRIAGPAG